MSDSAQVATLEFRARGKESPGMEGIPAGRAEAWEAESDAPATSLRRTHQKRETMQTLLRFIDEHLGQELRIPHLSERAGLCERRFYTLFRRSFGVSPKKYILGRRLDWARAMLANSGGAPLSVKAVALTAGFRDLGRFSGYYRARFGVSPSETLRLKKLTS